MQRRKVELIKKIMADDAEIRSHTEPWMKKLRTFLGSGSGLVGRVHQAQRRLRE
jgi:flagellar protein FliT